MILLLSFNLLSDTVPTGNIALIFKIYIHIYMLQFYIYSFLSQIFEIFLFLYYALVILLTVSHQVYKLFEMVKSHLHSFSFFFFKENISRFFFTVFKFFIFIIILGLSQYPYSSMHFLATDLSVLSNSILVIKDGIALLSQESLYVSKNAFAKDLDVNIFLFMFCSMINVGLMVHNILIPPFCLWLEAILAAIALIDMDECRCSKINSGDYKIKADLSSLNGFDCNNLDCNFLLSTLEENLSVLVIKQNLLLNKFSTLSASYDFYLWF